MKRDKEILKEPVIGILLCVLMLVVVIAYNNHTNPDKRWDSNREITIELNENIREYGTIKTYTFDIIDKNTGNICAMSSGVLSTKDIETKLNEHIKNNKYKVKSISVVKDQFYIQQDTSVSVDDEVFVKMIQIQDGFSADDFFALTEAVYDSVDVCADSLIRHNLNKKDESHLYYIYTYKDKNIASETVENIVPLNDKTENENIA